jgi:outer membrane protein TolC
VEAANSAIRAVTAKSAYELEKFKPNLEVYGQLGLGGRDDWGPQTNPALEELSRNTARIETIKSTLSTNHVSGIIGLRITAPICGDIKARKEQAAALEAESLRIAAKQRTFEAERDWNELTKRLADSRSKLVLARSLEEIQKKKLDHEQIKQRSGRSTTYQVLTFEQDFANAQLNSLRIKAETAEILSRMKVFGLK